MTEQLELFSLEPAEPVDVEAFTEDCIPGLESDAVMHLVFEGSQRNVLTSEEHEVGVWYRENVSPDEVRMWLEYGQFGDEARVGLMSIFRLQSGRFSCVAEIRDRNNPDPTACALVASGYENPFQVRHWVEEQLGAQILHYFGGAECTPSWDPIEEI